MSSGSILGTYSARKRSLLTQDDLPSSESSATSDEEAGTPSQPKRQRTRDGHNDSKDDFEISSQSLLRKELGHISERCTREQWSMSRWEDEKGKWNERMTSIGEQNSDFPGRVWRKEFEQVVINPQTNRRRMKDPPSYSSSATSRRHREATELEELKRLYQERSKRAPAASEESEYLKACHEQQRRQQTASNDDDEEQKREMEQKPRRRRLRSSSSSRRNDKDSNDDTSPSKARRRHQAWDDINTDGAIMTLQEKLVTLPEYSLSRNYKPDEVGRPMVNDDIVKAYEYHKAANTLKKLLHSDNDGDQDSISKEINSDPVLLPSLQRQLNFYDETSKSTLATPLNLLSHFEVKFMALAKYQVENDVANLQTIPRDAIVNYWLTKQRKKYREYKIEDYDINQQQKDDQEEKDDEANEESQDASKPAARPKVPEETRKRFKENVRLFDRLQIVLKTAAPKPHRTWESYMEELRAFKAKNGHCNVKRLEPGTNLGEWVSVLRREYDMLTNGVTPLRKNNRPAKLRDHPERIEELNELGFVWKIRHGRPKLGDSRFRLQRKHRKYQKLGENPSSGNGQRNDIETLGEGEE